MCFSATASFTAAALLAVSGGALLRRCKEDKTRIFLALIPCFFAAQQFSEGVLWTAFNYDAYGTWWSILAQYVFMFFAYLWWPTWIPIAYLMSEKVEWRKFVMITCLLAGLVFYCYIVFEYFRSPSIPAQVVGHSIAYASGSYITKLLYLAIVSIPIFASSIPRMWIVGILTVGTFLIADYYYTYAYASLWCFACAIIFAGLYFVLKPAQATQRNLNQ